MYRISKTYWEFIDMLKSVFWTKRNCQRGDKTIEVNPRTGFYIRKNGDHLTCHRLFSHWSLTRHRMFNHVPSTVYFYWITAVCKSKKTRKFERGCKGRTRCLIKDRCNRHSIELTWRATAHASPEVQTTRKKTAQYRLNRERTVLCCYEWRHQQQPSGK